MAMPRASTIKAEVPTQVFKNPKGKHILWL